MQEEKPVLLEQQKCAASSRRSRKDQEGRDFQCGCGKRYLSYPALYTHIKTKHEGKQPEGTQKTGNNIIIKKSKSKHDQEGIRGIYNKLQRQDVKLLKQTIQDFHGHVNFASRIKKQSFPKEISESYQYLIKHQQYSLNKQSSLDHILAIYLLNIGQFVNDKLYDNYIIFAKMARNCFNKYAEQIHSKCFNNKEGQNYIQFFSMNSVRHFPIICDFFVRYYIQFDQSAAEYKNINKSMIELMIFDFCEWLCKKKLTSIKCTLKRQYKHQVKANTSNNNLSQHPEINRSQQNNPQKYNKIDQVFQKMQINDSAIMQHKPIEDIGQNMPEQINDAILAGKMIQQKDEIIQNPAIKQSSS